MPPDHSHDQERARIEQKLRAALQEWHDFERRRAQDRIEGMSPEQRRALMRQWTKAISRTAPAIAGLWLLSKIKRHPKITLTGATCVLAASLFLFSMAGQPEVPGVPDPQPSPSLPDRDLEADGSDDIAATVDEVFSPQPTTEPPTDEAAGANLIADEPSAPVSGSEATETPEDAIPAPTEQPSPSEAPSTEPTDPEQPPSEDPEPTKEPEPTETPEPTEPPTEEPPNKDHPEDDCLIRIELGRLIKVCIDL